VIACIDANQHPDDVTPLRCVTAKVLISKTNDAVTQMTQVFRRIFRGRSQARGMGAGLHRCDRKTGSATARTGVRPQETIACGRFNPLMQKAATASDRTDRKK